MRIVCGAVIWAFMLGWLAVWLGSSPDPKNSPAGSIATWMTSSRSQVELVIKPSQVVATGDPIFLEGSESGPAIGRIVLIENWDGKRYEIANTDTAVAELFGGWQKRLGASSTGDLEIAFHQTPKSMAWVVRTMLSPSKREEISAIILKTVQEHQPEIVGKLQPLLLAGLRQSGDVLREDLRAAIASHQDEIRILAGRYQQEIIQKKVIPLFTEEIWPIVQEESWPIASEIGAEAWQQMSLFGLSWRYLYDASPLPERDLTRREFERLVRDQLTPLVTSWLPEIYAAQRRIFRRLGENGRVRQTATEVLTMLAEDHDLQAIILEVIRDVLGDNPRLVAAWQEVWETPEARATLVELNARLEPAITGIGEALFGNPRTSITPEFSTVMRNKVLFKDERWFIVRLRNTPSTIPDDGRLHVVMGSKDAPSPFHVPARPRN